MDGCRQSTPPVSPGKRELTCSHAMMVTSAASAVRLRRAWRQPRVTQPQRAAMGSVGAFEPSPSPAPDDPRIRVRGGAEEEASRERPNSCHALPLARIVPRPRPSSFAGDGWAFLRAGLASSWACLEGERTAQATTRRCTFTNVADEADRGRKSGSWDAEALTGASRAWEECEQRGAGCAGVEHRRSSRGSMQQRSGESRRARGD